ncbi:Threonine--tRNA ligase [bioreactor metagenome]|uniref:threonine--tRNA ligase n=1 Tax=bioreactor metagenome TaxID=1076179 RepID=A0A644V7D2_9ZZZZ|nr:threonine--tRNA ligase [Candidatus Elulimicrobiales bacterium]
MENEILEHKRHTLSHILASVLEQKYPGVKITLGPAIDTGFYYDVDFANETKPTEEKDFENITLAMKEKIKIGGNFSHKEVSRDEALEIFKDNEYKIELINEIAEKGETITLYTIDFTDGTKFTDLCRGGHAEDIKEIDLDSFKITHTAGAYWRGNENNKMLTRVYGLAFNNKAELVDYENKIEEAKKRDHRILGRELQLFFFSELVGPGLPLWTPRGTILRNSVDSFVQELRAEYGYGEVTIPHLTKKELYMKSGHWEKYQEDLFKIETRDGHTLCMKPMNCPHHAQIYASQLRSYKELPIRYSETTMVYRDEQSGELNGLSRVLSITQDDAHIFCRENQIEEEVENIWNLIEKFYAAFHFEDLKYRFSRRDDNPKFKGNIESWNKAETAIKNILNKRVGENYIDGIGEAAFYGPKIDFMAKDAIGREHQVATIQVDFIQPTNFGLEYVSETGSREMPVMIHCAIAGSLERFLSVYIEHVAGNFPLWMSPTQVAIIPINNENHLDFAKNISKNLSAKNIRIELKDEKDGLGKKVRYAKDMKIPYWIVVGDKEVAENKITLESREGEKFSLSLEELMEKLESEIKEKK